MTSLLGVFMNLVSLICQETQETELTWLPSTTGFWQREQVHLPQKKPPDQNKKSLKKFHKAFSTKEKAKSFAEVTL